MNEGDEEQDELTSVAYEVQKLNALESETKTMITTGETTQGKDLTPSNITDLMKLRFRIIEGRSKLAGIWPIEGGGSSE